MLIIPSLLYITLRSRAVQEYITQQISGYLSEELNVEVLIGGVNIGWFLNIVLEDVAINDKHQQPLINAERIVLDIRSFSIPKRSLIINRLVFDHTSMDIAKYLGEDEFNFDFLVDYFSRKDTTDRQEPDKWNIKINSIELKSSGVAFRDYNKSTRYQGFDYSNFSINDLNLVLKDISIQNDSLSASLATLSGRGSNGIRIENINGDLSIGNQGASINDLLIKTTNTSLSFDIALRYDGFESFSNFAHDVSFTVVLSPSIIDLYEVGYFFADAYGMKNKVELEGSISGNLANLRARDLLLKYGTMTELVGDFYITGLPNIQETFFNLSIEKLNTSQGDIESFRLPIASGLQNITFPAEIASLDSIRFSGSFTGFIYDFVAYGLLGSNAGNVSTDIAIISNYDFSRFRYRGNLSVHEFDLGKLLNRSDILGLVTLNTSLEGTGHSFETLELQITGLINSLEFNNYTYQNTQITGHLSNRRFNGNVIMNDPNISLHFAGLVDFHSEIPLLNFSAQIDSANLSKLNLLKSDSLYNIFLATEFTIDAHGNNINDIEGIFNSQTTHIAKIPIELNQELTAIYFTAKDINLEKRHLPDNQTLLRLTSDILDANLQGEINIENIGVSLNNFASAFAPSRFNPIISSTNIKGFQNINFEIHIKNLNQLTSLIIPEFRIADNSTVTGNWNTQLNDLNIHGLSEHISLNNIIARNIELNVNTEGDQIVINTRSSRVNLSDSIWMDRFALSGSFSNDTFPLYFKWDNHESDKKNNGLITAVARFSSPTATEIIFAKSQLYINDSLWNINEASKILIDSTFIAINDFHLFRDEVFLKADGVLSNNPNENLGVEFHRFNVENLNHLLRGRRVDFGGIANGKITVSGLNTNPNITANLTVEEFAFNRDELGDLELFSYWDAEKNGFRIETNIIYHGNIGFNTPVSASGYFFPDRKYDNFDIDIVIANFKMSVFGRYLEKWASNFRGLASGVLRLEGPLSAPELSGRARLVRTGLRIDYTNTAYTFAHEIEVGKDFIRFDNLVLNDTLGNTAIVNGLLRHRNFMNFNVDISILLDRMIVLNTRPYTGTPFYGKGFASGMVHIHGPGNNIVLDISAQANRGTQIFLPINHQGEIKESSFITFVTPTTVPTPAPTRRAPVRTITMNLDLTVTPESEVQIIFDSQIGDIIRSRGSGNLKFELTPQGAFYMYGDYVIDEGDYLFTLQNLLNKRFRIEQGGLIRWNGNPNDAEIDIRAIYRTRTSLADLAAPMMQNGASDALQRRIPVETVLHLTNRLLTPNINFDIQLPGGDEATRDLIQRLITTEQEMNRQVFSLLILNRFTPSPTEYNTAFGYGVGSTSFELLSNQLSNWLSQISSDLDIGINYRPGDEITSQEVEVALSTQLFNNRLVIDGNVGVAGNHPSQTQRTSNIIGDVNIEYRITPEGMFRVKAFNRSNAIEILNTTAPYTQGIGIFYRKEFDNLGELFRRNRRVPLNEIPDPEEIETTLPATIDTTEVNLVPQN